MAAITFLSDFGRADEFVGVVHSVITSINPGARVIDLCHDVAPHDVASGAAMLARAAPYLADGVLLAVVDPGVGGGRRRLVLDCGRLTMVGPDNGLLTPAADAVGGIRRAFEADRPEHWLAGPPRARTFDGRDVFGPLAARLASGLAPEDTGTPLDPASLVRPAPPLVHRSGDRLETEVVWVDRFGNAALAARAADLGPTGAGRWSVRPARGQEAVAVRIGSFAELGPSGEDLGLLEDSSGHLALVLDRASAAARLALAVGDRIEIVPL